MTSMSNPYAAHSDPYMTEGPPRRGGSNVLGIFGFVLSLTCCLSPVGLLLSLIALGKSPRVFAVLGTVFGVIGTVLLAVSVWAGSQMMPVVAKFEETTQSYKAIDRAISTWMATSGGQAPADLSVVSLPSGADVDGWGTPFKFTPSADGLSWTLVSAGPDGQFDTPDDVVFTPGMSDDDIKNSMRPAIESAIESHFGVKAPPRAPGARPSPDSGRPAAPTPDRTGIPSEAKPAG
jgi:hypothetical protein